MLFNEGLEQQQSTLNSVDLFGLDHCHDQVPNQASVSDDNLVEGSRQTG